MKHVSKKESQNEEDLKKKLRSLGLHFVIMYVPVLATIFSIVPLTLNDWLLVLAFSFPVIIVDEALKLVGRVRERAAFHRRMEKEE
ncbi:hypothetical protein EMIHUDRAFT_251608 [Emiliania huxleyi CCMP1516]|uniref:Cation-transporting P-type ATPase C-terminal domain-containing protein n=2 Tax=Emiliania huxleyi TaxID=2903 RepID=A0A0D3KT51_EMIH1|nr:hypothetical protein EMIHUDRAFT_251608 [Emiliania huxleyi CCMP1516]EOD38936.1 hypothetical protein EMIHUDRAFT_251608 [Emiliania huxleyi CCMP1516]|eukprot:XP_005791365.1 hypothetical protein EMIHUDRAFT_251608 [Emiliania huxleyi CCMP1516]